MLVRNTENKMSELKQSEFPELDRALNAIYLEVPESVGNDVNRIVRESLATSRRNAFDKAIEIASQPINTLGWGSASGAIAQEIIVKTLTAERDKNSHE
jgi:hypothetical protein